MLPTWWRDASKLLASNDDLNDLPDTEWIVSRLLDHGFAVVDNFLGLPMADAVRGDIHSLDQAGKLRLGRLQYGSKMNTDDEVRSDRIFFAGREGDECPAAITSYIAVMAQLRERLTQSDELVGMVGGGLDGCTHT